MNITKDPVYQDCFKLRQKRGFSKLGLSSAISWHDDPKRMAFLFSRYKFVAKILSDKKSVLEIGCSDGFNSRILLQEVKNLTISDIDNDMLKNAKEIINSKWKLKVIEHNFERKRLSRKFDAIYTLDTLEHINKKKEQIFIKNVSNSLNNDGVLVVGAPSLEFQKFSRPKKLTGHINCKTGAQLKRFLLKFFANVFIFSMNDETVHTGFQKMSCYFFAVCTNKKKNI